MICRKRVLISKDAIITILGNDFIHFNVKVHLSIDFL